MEDLNNGVKSLEMEVWHTCNTAHCIAGHAFPEESSPGQKASLLYPTLAGVFFANKEEAINVLKAVAEGRLSVFN